MLSRRDFGKNAVFALAASRLVGAKINSIISGVKVGAISYCFRSLPRPATGDYIDTIIQAFLDCGIGFCELTSPMLEPPNTLPGGGRVPPDTPENRKMRAELRQWRLSEPLKHFQDVRKKFDNAGITLIGYVNTFAEDYPDEEIDAVFRHAHSLGINMIGTNQTTVGMAPRLVPYADKYKMDLSFHNHAMSEDPNEVASPESFERLFAMSKRYKANLDIGHFTAGNNDGIAFIEKHHDKITHIHLKDRKRDNGPNVPWGEGDTPLNRALTLIRDRHYPIYCIIEYEYRGSGTAVEETNKCLAYIKRALAS